MLKGESVVIEGHSDHVRHLFKSLLSPSWPNHGKLSVRGQHTEAKKYLEENQPTTEENKSSCSVCDKTFDNKGHKKSMQQHMKKHLAENHITDMIFEEAKIFVAEYFKQHFDIEWNNSEFDKLMNEGEIKA